MVNQRLQLLLLSAPPSLCTNSISPYGLLIIQSDCWSTTFTSIFQSRKQKERGKGARQSILAELAFFSQQSQKTPPSISVTSHLSPSVKGSWAVWSCAMRNVARVLSIRKNKMNNRSFPASQQALLPQQGHVCHLTVKMLLATSDKIPNTKWLKQ